MPETQPSNPPATRDLTQVGAIAGAIFGALVGADPFDVRNRTSWVRAIDYVAIALWVGAVLLFLFAAAARNEARPAGISEDKRPLSALATAGVAGILTMVALIAVPFSFSEDHDTVTLKLAPQEQRAISDLCGLPATTTTLGGRIMTQTLRERFVVLEIRSVTGSTCDTVRIPADAILAMREHPYRRP